MNKFSFSRSGISNNAEKVIEEHSVYKLSEEKNKYDISKMEPSLHSLREK